MISSKGGCRGTVGSTGSATPNDGEHDRYSATCSPKVNAKVRVLNVDTGITPELGMISGESGASARVTATSGDGIVSNQGLFASVLMESWITCSAEDFLSNASVVCSPTHPVQPGLQIPP